MRKYLLYLASFLTLMFLVQDISYSGVMNLQYHFRKNARANETIVGGDGGLSGGNVSSFMISGNLLLKYVKDDHLVSIYGNASYGEQETKGVKYRISSSFTQQIRYHIPVITGDESWLELATFLQYQYDEFKRIKTRIANGIGPRPGVLLFDKKLEISGAVSYMFEYVRLDSATYSNSSGIHQYTDMGEGKVEHRLSNYINFGLSLSQGLNIFSTTFYQPLLTEFGDFRIFHDTSLYITPKGMSSLTIYMKFVWAHDSRPPDQVDATDYNFQSGIMVSVF